MLFIPNWQLSVTPSLLPLGTRLHENWDMSQQIFLYRCRSYAYLFVKSKYLDRVRWMFDSQSLQNGSDGIQMHSTSNSASKDLTYRMFAGVRIGTAIFIMFKYIKLPSILAMCGSEYIIKISYHGCNKRNNAFSNHHCSDSISGLK